MTFNENDIRAAVDELITTLGVSEDVADADFLGPLYDKRAYLCAQRIADQLRLPITVNLSYVARDHNQKANRFQGGAVSRTDTSGRGYEGIVAQVSIPGDLPTWGSSRLSGFNIEVRVSTECHEQPELFVTALSHELSHILLHVLGHPKMESELYTDLVPIIMGFRQLIRIGRMQERERVDGNVVITSTTRYGYLNDSQFDAAFKRVDMLLSKYQHDKALIHRLALRLNSKLQEVQEIQRVFMDIMLLIDAKPPRKIKQEYADAVIRFHMPDYLRDRQITIDNTKHILSNANTFIRNLNHYMGTVSDQIDDYNSQLYRTLDEVDKVGIIFANELKILSRSLRPYDRIRWAFKRKKWKYRKENH